MDLQCVTSPWFMITYISQGEYRLTYPFWFVSWSIHSFSCPVMEKLWWHIRPFSLSVLNSLSSGSWYLPIPLPSPASGLWPLQFTPPSSTPQAALSWSPHPRPLSHDHHIHLKPLSHDLHISGHSLLSAHISGRSLLSAHISGCSFMISTSLSGCSPLL